MDILKQTLHVSYLEVVLFGSIECFTFKENVFDGAGHLACRTLRLLFLPEYERMRKSRVANTLSGYSLLDFLKTGVYSLKMGLIWNILLWIFSS